VNEIPDKVLIYCPECGNKDKWKIEVESKGQKRIVTIVCTCGWSQQYTGTGESVYKSSK
jgi:hypothetical protein